MAPTELLAEDVRDLRESNRQIAVEIKDLATSVNGLRTEFAGFRASVETQLAFIKWVGTVFTAVLIAVVAGAGGLIWNASALNSEVKQQGVRLNQVDPRLDKTDQRLDRIDQQLGLIVQRLDQIVPKPKP